METLEEFYQYSVKTKSDINEHVETIYKYALKCKHVTEFGVRGVVSTWGVLMALKDNGGKGVSYDIVDCNVNMPTKICIEEQIEWNFKVGNSMEIDIDPTDMLFIDTEHRYHVLKAELERHHSKVSKYILLHDTETFGPDHNKHFPNEPGLQRAINEFIKDHGTEWKVKEVYTHNNGLTILEKIS